MLVTPPSSPEEEAALALLKLAYKLGAEKQLCPVCLLLGLGQAVSEQLAAREIEHGVPDPDINLDEI